MPELRFRIEAAEVLTFAAAPTLLFKLDVACPSGESIRSLALNTQLRIAVRQRAYAPGEEAGLVELFGPRERWKVTLGSLLWTHTTLMVPAFSGRTLVDMPVACTYDFEVASAKYFHALAGGEVPLEFLFSGTLFYTGERGLQAEQIPWDQEAQFRLPVSLWREMMDHHFPGSAWLRLHRDTFDRLLRYKAERGLPSWEAALDTLLPAQMKVER